MFMGLYAILPDGKFGDTYVNPLAVEVVSSLTQLTGLIGKSVSVVTLRTGDVVWALGTPEDVKQSLELAINQVPARGDELAPAG